MRTLKQLFSLHGKVALVTGGAGHLGTEICHALLELGAKVVIASRNLDNSQKKCKEIQEIFQGTVDIEAIELELTNKRQIQETARRMEEQYGGLDILVNNAWSGKKNSFESITDEDWDYDIEMSLNSVFRMVKATLPGLKEKKGVVLNITSMYGHVAPDYRIYDGIQFANPPSYGAAKAGVIQFTKYLASFLSPYGIRVNCLSPGPFPTSETQKNQDFISNLSAKNPLNRIGQPHEIKGAVALLCSDASSYMTGQNICVDGGWTSW
ncbi:gluconate 5-dehydrogenase [Xylanibacillus composti]|uniref:Gluconate 5-dehydrogenase n=1 Tax=Xylanibacillus composti TaxID=1572762 RepID=A0A8J4M2L3_9BACL|nr:SDR family oxidoreductase [Xylanibacillus composti]GIQ69990.1 gluconate 5-dehydrogenase [Xylanibacillus composti]